MTDPAVAYLVVEDQAHIVGFAILLGLLSVHKSVELKRLVVGTLNQGAGRKLLAEVAERAFGQYGAHRLFLDVFVNNDRARHVYETFGFRREGTMRDAICRDGVYHSLVLMSLLHSEYRSTSEHPYD